MNTEEFEKKRQINLPNEFKMALADKSLTISDRRWFWYKPLLGPKAETFLEEWLDIEEMDTVCDNLQDIVPPEFIAIAETLGGSVILLGVGESNKGTVQYWDNLDQLEEDEGYYTGNIYFLANTLSEFLDSLMTEEEIERSKNS